MAFTIPERIRWAVDMLAAKSSDSLLEIGCGRGIAVALLARRLTTGRILAIDRSASAIAAARERNWQWDQSGRARFRHASLRDLDDAEGRFDKIFAINVNLFWTDPRADLPVVRKLLKDEGGLYLFYEPPEAQRREEIAEKVAARLSNAGLVVRKTVMKDIEAAPLLGLIASHTH
jgi:cyclopropane fatty-acyl-phospholipid synthase-like methyltransferase